MATRFRLPNSGTPGRSPAFQSYTHSGSTRIPLVTTDSTALATNALTPDAADHIAAGDTVFAQFVSGMMKAGITFTNGDAISLAVQCLESDAGDNLFVQLFVAIVSEDGGTVRRTIRSKVADGLELATTITNRNLTTTQDGATYVTVHGDRLVVELSVTGTPVATGGVQGHNASLRFGSNGGGGDLGANDTDTLATLNPWIDFAPTVTFVDPIANGDIATEVPAARKPLGIAALTIALGLLQTTLAPPNPRIGQWDWPVPLRAQTYFLSDGETRPAPSTDIPFSQDAWPNPIAKQAIRELANWSQSKPSYYVDATTPQPFTPDDWPTPSAKPVQRDLSFTQSKPSYYVDATNPFTPDDWPAPAAKPAARDLWSVAQSKPTYYVDASGTPFTQTEWANPRVQASSRVLTTWTVSAALTDAPPFVQTDWTPPLTKPISRDLRTIAPNALTLGTLAVPFSQTDWAAPVGQSAIRDLRTGLSPNTLPLGTVQPFTQTEWPTPSGLAPIRDLRTGPVQNPLIGPLNSLQPFDQTEWPNPIAKAAGSIVLRTWIDQRRAYFVEVIAPRQSEWPNPLQRAALRDLLTWHQPPNTLISLLTVVQAVPFSQADWIAPLAKPAVAIGQRTWTQSPAVPPTPFSQADWPNPAPRVASVIVARTWTQTPSVPATPFSQEDWPNPSLKPAGVISQRTWIQTPAVQAAPLPFGQSDWPNPRRGGTSLDLRTSASDLLQSTLAPIQVPFSVEQWPNPRLKPSAVGLQTWTDRRRTYLVDLVPFGQSEWPLPLGKTPALALRIWTVDLQAVTLVPPGSGPFELFMVDDAFMPAGVSGEGLLNGAAVSDEGLQSAASSTDTFAASDQTGESLWQGEITDEGFK